MTRSSLPQLFAPSIMLPALQEFAASRRQTRMIAEQERRAPSVSPWLPSLRRPRSSSSFRKVSTEMVGAERVRGAVQYVRSMPFHQLQPHLQGLLLVFQMQHGGSPQSARRFFHDTGDGCDSNGAFISWRERSSCTALHTQRHQTGLQLPGHLFAKRCAIAPLKRQSLPEAAYCSQ